MLRLLRHIILTLLALCIGGVGAWNIIKMKPKAAMKPQVNQGLLVEVQQFALGDQPAVVIGQGLIEPAERVSLIAQVSGVVQALHSELSVGGLVKKGDRLVQIDATDYSLAVKEAKARVKIAQQEVTLEEGRSLAAQQEWEMMQKRSATEVSAEARDRALRGPQRAIAESNLKIAQSALARAQVSYGRTILQAPFNGVVLTEAVDKGQLVGPGAPIATLAGTDEFWVTASIPTSELGWIDFPPQQRSKSKGRRKTERGSRVLIRYDVGAYVIEREGYVIRQLTQVETTGRMARIVVGVEDPLGLKTDVKALLLGAQVEVHIIGRQLEGVIEIPRAAIHNEDEVWIFTPSQVQAQAAVGGESKLSQSTRDGVLEIRRVKILRRLKESVLIKEGLRPDEQIITSRIATPVPGMIIRSSL